MNGLRLSGRIAEALAYINSMKSLYPHKGDLWLLLAICHMQTKDIEKASEALDEAGKVGTSVYSKRVSQGAIYAMTRRRDEAENVLAELSGDSNVKLLNAIVLIRSLLGDLDEAFDALFKLAEMHAWSSYITVDPIYGNLRKDPRFKDFLRIVGIK